MRDEMGERGSGGHAGGEEIPCALLRRFHRYTCISWRCTFTLPTKFMREEILVWWREGIWIAIQTSLIFQNDTNTKL